MFNSSSNGVVPSLSDIAAVTGANNNDGFGGGWGGAWLWIIVIIAIFGWGGNWGGGFGGNGGGTSAVLSTFDTDYLAQGLRDIQAGLASNFLTLNNENLSGVCDIRGDIASNGAAITAAITNGFATQNLQNMTNTNAITSEVNAGTIANMQNTYALQSTLAQMASDNRADAAQNAYNQATNTCAIQTSQANGVRDIVQAVNDGNRAILEAMAQNKVEAMQDKINDLTSQLQTANFLASQAAQTNDIMQGQQALANRLDPTAVPAYIVANPNGCNCAYRYNAMNYTNV